MNRSLTSLPLIYQGINPRLKSRLKGTPVVTVYLPPPPQVCKDIRAVLQKQVDGGKEVQLLSAVKTTTITRGLKYSLATGNWGQQGTQGIRAGVSQVRGAGWAG